MKFSLFTAAATVLPCVSAHYFFDVLVIDGKETRSMEFVRSNTRQAKYNPTKWKNALDGMTPDVTDFRCNKGAFTFAGQTGTAEVKAGSTLAMKLAVGATMRHPGPMFVYASRSPSTAKAYEGDGEWFKIFEAGICKPGANIKEEAWCSWDKDRIEFKIPLNMPDGEYLLRPEHIGLHGAHDGQAEFYYGCAQVKVTGGGNGQPGPTIKLPSYKKDDPSYNFSVWGGFKDYPMPYPPVWNGTTTTQGNAAQNNAAPSTGSAGASQNNAAPSKGSSAGASQNNAAAGAGAGAGAGANTNTNTPVPAEEADDCDDGESETKLPRDSRSFRASLRK